jgi:hypothetical protein
VEWSGTVTPANNRVWVWVDLCPVNGTTPDNSFSTATISNPTKENGNGAVIPTNTRGFFIEYANANNSGTTVTATLSNATGKFNWCAYGSDFPPNAIENGSGYTLKGSPPFIITTSSGTFEEHTRSFSGGTITALTDATGCPGMLCGKNGESVGLLNCCTKGTYKCSGVCRTVCNENTCEACLQFATAKYTYVQWNPSVYCWVSDRPCPINPHAYVEYIAYRWNGSSWTNIGEYAQSTYCGSYTRCNY